MALYLKDLTTNGNDFVVSGGTIVESTDLPTITGNVNSADFAVSSTLSCVNDFTNIDASDFTIELWLKQKGTAGDRTIANKNGFAGLNLYIQDDDTLVAQVNSTSSASTTTFTSGSWGHIALAYNKSAGQLHIYKDGTFVETISGLSTGGIPNNASVLFLSSPASNGFYVDEYRVWSNQRSDTQISNNYNVKLVGNESGLVLYLPFDPPVVNTLEESYSYFM